MLKDIFASTIDFIIKLPAGSTMCGQAWESAPFSWEWVSGGFLGTVLW